MSVLPLKYISFARFSCSSPRVWFSAGQLLMQRLLRLLQHWPFIRPRDQSGTGQLVKTDDLIRALVQRSAAVGSSLSSGIGAADRSV